MNSKRAKKHQGHADLLRGLRVLLKTGEAVVGDNVKIQIDAEMVKKK